MKVGIIGDLHLKPLLTYADHVEDRREGEVKEILDFIVEAFAECEAIVFMGDLFNARNNQSEVIRRLVFFIERFSGKEIFIIAGNHEKSADGTSALDFLKEIRNPKWHIFTDDLGQVDGMVFCPYFKRQELRCDDNDTAREMLLERLGSDRILFCHHAFSGSITDTGTSTDAFNELVLRRKELEKKFSLCVGGHIHSPQWNDKFIVTGSVFVNEMNEKPKYVFLLDTETLAYEPIPLPGRTLCKVENPEISFFKDLRKDSIVKVVLTDPDLKTVENDIKEFLKGFDGFMLLEQFPNERRKVVTQENLLDFGLEEILKEYAKRKGIDPQKLLDALKLIKE